MDRRFFYGARPLDLRTWDFVQRPTQQAYGSAAIQRWGVQRTGDTAAELHVRWGTHDFVELTLVVPAWTEVRHGPRLIAGEGFNPLVWTMQWRDKNGSCTLRTFMTLIYELQIT